jgi:hypothetical protein
MDLVETEIAADFEHGKPLFITGTVVRIPPEVIDDHEIVYRVRRAPEMQKGDLLAIEPRNSAATEELVVAFRGPRAYLGRWWAKHGLHELQVENQEPLTGLTIAGAVNLVLRANDEVRSVHQGEGHQACSPFEGVRLLPPAPLTASERNDGAEPEVHRRSGQSLPPSRS